MEKGRKPTPNSYICDLNEMMFAIACRQQPSQGTKIQLVIPVIFSYPLEKVEQIIFLLDKKIYSVCGMVDDSFMELTSSTMRRKFYISNSFPVGERRTNYSKDVIEISSPGTGEKLYLTYYWRSLEEKNSAFRR